MESIAANGCHRIMASILRAWPVKENGKNPEYQTGVLFTLLLVLPKGKTRNRAADLCEKRPRVQ
jgi:hypothetical protein